MSEHVKVAKEKMKYVDLCILKNRVISQICPTTSRSPRKKYVELCIPENKTILQLCPIHQRSNVYLVENRLLYPTLYQKLSNVALVER